MDKESYPRCKEAGLTVEDGVVLKESLKAYLMCLGPLNAEKFHDYFGVQTVDAKGPYAWDVEAVLERMKSGKLILTQLDWD